MVRVLLHNTTGIGFCTTERSRETQKMEKLRNFVIKHKIDILSLTETNKNWAKITDEDTIWNAIRKWRREARTYAAYNQLDKNSTKQQYGGTSLSLFGESVRHKQKHGVDQRKLGRWTWTTLEGRANKKTLLISAYCPCPSHGEASVWTQHLATLQELREELPAEVDTPRKLFWHDLSEFTSEYNHQGYNIMITGDFNSDFTQTREWMIQHGLVEAICEQHGYEEAPKTHLRSQDAPIDGIYCSPNLKAQHSGYLAFSSLGGDHRGLWVDIPEILLFGYNPPTSSMAHARRLKLEDPRVVKKYNDVLHKLLLENQVYEHQSYLHQRATYPPPEWQTKEYEKVDRIIERCMEEAEKKCRKFKCGEVQWSPLYQQIYDTIDYWNLRLQHFLPSYQKNHQLLIRMQKRLSIDYERLTKAAVKIKLKEAHERRRKYKKIATEQSMEYRNQLAQAKEEAGNKTAATYLRELNEKEAIRILFHRIKLIEKRINAGTTSQIQRTQEDGTIVKLVLRKEIEQAIIKGNEAKYHETEGTSDLLSPEFIKLFGHYGEKEDIEKVLDGTFIPPISTSEAATAFLEACQRPNEIGDIKEDEDPVNRFHTFIKNWKCRKERTSSANQHIGHYKAGIKHPYISWCLFQRHEFPTITGYSPDRHRRCIDLSILKKSGNYNIEKQRTLGLLDSEFNQMNKEMGRESMHSALDHNLIATEQYSRPNRSAIDHALNRILTFDHFRYERKPFCIASCDLKGCYDRIIHAAAYLALRRVGVRRPKLLSMFSTIQRMVHKIRTSFGDSEDTYGGDDIEDWDNYAQGILQGNASGPQIWSILSSIIFEILTERGFSVNFCSCLSKSLFSLLGFSYVDDCDLLQSKDDTKDTIEAMQTVINNWTELMAVTGGQIEAKKSWWYLANVKWIKGKWDIVDEPTDTPLTITYQGLTEILKRLSVKEASEMLGIWMSLEGNHTKMLKHLRSETLKWASNIKSGNPSKIVAWTALHQTISAKMKYSMPVSRFSKKECDYIMAPAIAIGLQKSGVNKCFPSAARHAPIQSGGLHVLSLYNEMGVARTVALIEHCHGNTPTGQFMQTNIEHLVMETGLYGTLWQMNADHLELWCDTRSWIFHTIKYNHDRGIQLNIEHTYIKPQRMHDKALMDLAFQFTTEPRKLKAINRVRILHEVIHLSDITTANGTRIDPAFLISDPFPEKRNDYSWPKKHHVTTSDFTIWRQFINNIYDYDQFTLQRPLSHWTQLISPAFRMSWHWFLDNTNNILYERVNNEYAQHRPRSRRSRYYTYDCTITPTLPTNVLLASVHLADECIQLLNTNINCPTPLPPEPQPPPQFIREDIINILKQHLPPWASQRVGTTPTLCKLKAAIIDGTAVMVSDGSHFPLLLKAGQAWCISTLDYEEFICGGGATPGDPNDHDSYRSEVAGLIGSSTALQALLPLLPTHTNKYTIVCDNESALKILNPNHRPEKTKWRHCDLVSILRHIWKNMPCSPNPVHVYGHQDKAPGDRSPLEKINIHMDRRARACAQIYTPIQSHGKQWNTKGFSLVQLNGQMIGGAFKKTLYDSICHRQYVKYISNKWGHQEEILLHQVAWTQFAKARKATRHHLRIFISKWLVEHLPTGAVMKKWKQRLHARCPHCQHSNEDILHMTTCKSVTIQNFWSQSLQALETWMINKDTDPDLQQFIIEGLKSWIQNPQGDEITLQHFPVHKQPIFQNQLNLGWFAFLSGLIHPSLVTLQQQHYSLQSKKYTGASWTTQIIQQLWHHLFELWLLRNQALHQRTIDDNHGIEHLDYSISVEYHIGPLGLPSHFNGYFTQTLDKLLAKDTISKKKWFQLIRRAREVRNLTIRDAFHTNTILRNWVHLPTTA